MRKNTLLSEKDGWEFTLSNIIVILFLCGMCSRIFYHIAISSNGYLDFVTDDFFYYFLPAKNLIARGFSSFDGMTITNGYHPLWMIVISALYWASGGSEQLFFAMLAIASALSSYLTFRLLWKLRDQLFPHALLISSAILIVTVSITGLSFLGMEVTLTIPLYAYLLLKISRLNLRAKISAKQFISLGFLSSLLILSRLDTGLFIFLFLIFFLAAHTPDTKRKIYLLTFFALGGIFVPLYFLTNYYWLGHFMTVSSAAKTLKADHSINFGLVKYLVLHRDGLAGLILSPIALGVLLFTRKKRPENSHTLVCYLALIFPIIYYFILLYGSDWFLNRWYLYPLPFCFFISAGIFSNHFFSQIKESHVTLLRKLLLAIASIGAIAFSATLVLRDTTQWKPETSSVFANAEKMLPFIREHPGIYAMGDQAGLTAYILQVPIIQLEGLSTDFRMYEHIKHHDNLNDVLHEYHVDYLIETFDKFGLPKANGCYSVEEPHSAQAGIQSTKMRGELCAEPVYRQTISNVNGYEMNSFIFDLKK